MMPNVFQWLPSSIASVMLRYSLDILTSDDQELMNCVSQGFHNLTVDNHYMLDPLLTPHGEEQCHQFSQSFPFSDSISLITVSPLRRTIYTALLSFPSPINDRKVSVIALPELQEIGDLACDTGSDLGVLSKEMADRPIDLSLVEKGWEIKEGRWAPTGEAIEKRAREARQWLRARPEKEIALVAHGGLLHYLTEDWSGSGKYTGEIAPCFLRCLPRAGCLLFIT